MADKEKEDTDLKNSADDEDETLDEQPDDKDGAAGDDKADKDKPEYTEREKKLFARTKKAEADLKAEKAARKAADDKLKAKEKSDSENEGSTTALTDELKLTARGMSDELIAEAKDIAKGKGISLMEAVKTKQFELLESAEKEEKRKAKAKLAASSGSGGSSDDMAEQFPSGQKREDHKKNFEKVVGKK